MPDTDSKIMIENVTSPGRTYRVDRAKYMAMREALMAVLPAEPPGMTVADARSNLLRHLPQNLFPGGDKAGWWLKAVQLDLEAKGTIGRTAKPVRLFRLPDRAARIAAGHRADRTTLDAADGPRAPPRGKSGTSFLGGSCLSMFGRLRTRSADRALDSRDTDF